MNRAIIAGNLGADPDVKALTSGTVCHFNIATTEKWVKDGEAHEKTEWHKIVVWGKLAESCGKYLTKGSQVLVEGRLQTRKWEDSEGRERHTTEIIAETVKFLDRKKTSDGGLPL
jgi:single-strand DNA-binding protein